MTDSKAAIARRGALDCVIVGAGPAGLTAALYLRRFHREVCVIDAGASRAGYIPRSQNVAGFPDGISGADLLARMNLHLRQVDGQVVHGKVRSIERDAHGLFLISLADQELRTRNVILCTGVVDRRPSLPGIESVADAGLLRACPICDGYEFTGKRIGVLANSTHGLKEALFLRHFSDSVSLIQIDAGLSGSDIETAQRARIQCPTGLASHAAVMTESHEQAVFVTMDDGGGHPFDALYAALGVDPCTQLAVPLGAQLDKQNNLVTDAHCRTSVTHLYAAGDVVSALDQISVAVGHAAIAATSVHNSLLNEAC